MNLYQRRRTAAAAGIEVFLRQIKELGYPVKLDTNGSFPDRLEHLIDEGLVDYVAMGLEELPRTLWRNGRPGLAGSCSD